jgi:hypothetical protein
VKFTGLVPHGPYFAVGEDVNGNPVAINFTADGDHKPFDERYTQPESAAQSLREANAAAKVREGQPAIAGSSSRRAAPWSRAAEQRECGDPQGGPRASAGAASA